MLSNFFHRLEHGGIIIAWKSTLFMGEKIFSNQFGLTVQFCSLLNNASWVLTCVYGPYTTEGKSLFMEWFKNIDMPATVDWIVMGDFNLIRSLEDRNKSGGNISEILMFNEAISLLGIQEVPLQGKRFTWSNMQPSPLLEKLDWIFISASWNITYPYTAAKTLDMIPSDHTPCLVNISTRIPKAKCFRFENFWLLDEQFPMILNSAWLSPVNTTDRAKIITAKLKILRKKLRDWQATKTGIHTSIANSRLILQLLESFEDFRDLSLEEWEFRNILKNHLTSLLEKQRIFWKQRGTIKWASLGDAGTKFFHSCATIKYKKNLITQLEHPNGNMVSEHR